tara:strand:+ start:656 stop:889 length:234 start_codon:yes stop_codon:yes gene_type:complete
MSTKVDDTLHLKNFIEIINKADNARQREVKIDVELAKRVRNSLTTILIHYAEIQSRKIESSSVNDVSMDGGMFGDEK